MKADVSSEIWLCRLELAYDIPHAALDKFNTNLSKLSSEELFILKRDYSVAIAQYQRKFGTPPQLNWVGTLREYGVC